MKIFFISILIPLASLAGFSKPELLARFIDRGAWNVADNTWCFSGEPQSLKGDVYLNCFDAEGNLMYRNSSSGFDIVARAESDNFFSRPVSSFGKIAWYEFDEANIVRSYLSGERLEKIEISNLGPTYEHKDSFLPLTGDSFFFKSTGESPKLYSWKNNEVTPLFGPKASYIFTPQVGYKGEIALKTRDLHLGENAPDRLWFFNGTKWEIVLEDQDTNPTSRWKSFRHQLSVDGNKILLIAHDGKNESLVLLENGQETILATAGKELKSFDYFTPKLQNGVMVVRGMDHDGLKAIYVQDKYSFRKLVSQGDIVQTDLGPGRVFYQNPDAIFYGAPGVDESGNVYLQATLTDPDHPATLLGIGLVKFHNE